jgi:predicted oxidoreductase
MKNETASRVHKMGKEEIKKASPPKIKVLKRNLFDEFSSNMLQIRLSYQDMLEDELFKNLPLDEQLENRVIFLEKTFQETIRFSNFYSELSNNEDLGGRNKEIFGLEQTVERLVSKHFRAQKEKPSAQVIADAYSVLAKEVNNHITNNGLNLSLMKTKISRTTIKPYLDKVLEKREKN